MRSLSQAAIADCERRLAKLTRDIDQGFENLARVSSALVQRGLEAKLEAWAAERSAVEAELAEFRAQTPAQEDVGVRADRHLALLDDFPRNMETAPVGAQKAFYRAALTGIEVLWDPKRPRNQKLVKATMTLSPDMTRLAALASSICNGDPVQERVEARA